MSSNLFDGKVVQLCEALVLLASKTQHVKKESETEVRMITQRLPVQCSRSMLDSINVVTLR